MPLQNRVLPSGDIITLKQRGELMGNRGGRLHDPETRQLHLTRRWVSKQWICCLTSFKNRQRSVMGNSYTELFFLDEVTALAAGHRPCFECRRKPFLAYAEALRLFRKLPARMTAKQMDDILHVQRLSVREKAVHLSLWGDLPNGAAILLEDAVVMKNQGHALQWTSDGYRPFATTFSASDRVPCLTPELSLQALLGGYEPIWHSSINAV